MRDGNCNVTEIPLPLPASRLTMRRDRERSYTLGKYRSYSETTLTVAGRVFGRQTDSVAIGAAKLQLTTSAVAGWLGRYGCRLNQSLSDASMASGKSAARSRHVDESRKSRCTTDARERPRAADGDSASDSVRSRSSSAAARGGRCWRD